MTHSFWDVNDWSVGIRAGNRSWGHGVARLGDILNYLEVAQIIGEDLGRYCLSFRSVC